VSRAPTPVVLLLLQASSSTPPFWVVTTRFTFFAVSLSLISLLPSCVGTGMIPSGAAAFSYPAVERAWRDGVSSSVVAYGPAGSGKAFSVVGTLPQPGLLPRLLAHLAHLAKRAR
jgi:hypothetical protein